MRLLVSGLLLITGVGMTSCSSQDSELKQNSKEFASAHRHPFEITTTDSSIIGRYVWDDTLREYSMGISVPNEDGLRELGKTHESFGPVPLVNGSIREWPFEAFGFKRLTNGCTIHFGHPGLETEFGYAWKYDGGIFNPIFIR